MNSRQSPITLLLLILAGEAIFVLPFVLARIFRPTFLAVFDISNEELGYCFSVYGVVALISYLLGGGLADRFRPKYLIAISLWLTAIGGFILMSYPSYLGLKIIFGFWGFSTIFLFWAALIKATRIWGAHKSQGKAYGILDGGRGLVGALFGFLGIYIFTQSIGDQIDLATLEQKKEIFASIILASSIFVILIGVLVFFFLQETDQPSQSKRIDLQDIAKCLKHPAVWLIMLIVLCAYTGYKSTDYFSQYAFDIMNFSDISSGKIGTYMLVLRAVSAVGFGFLADRFDGSTWLIVSFGLVIIGSVLFVSGYIAPPLAPLFIANIIITGIGVYGLRALYFAVMKESNIPLGYTGTAVGIISVVGYLPDIFFGPISGRLIDQNPGIMGFQLVFGILLICSVIGIFSSLILSRINKK